MKMETGKQSPNYGGRIGYGIFYYVVRWLGLTPAYVLLAFIVPYYVLLRPGARRSAHAFLRHRFPDRGGLWRFFARFAYFYRFGQVLIDQGALGVIGPGKARVEFPAERGLYERSKSGHGLVLITSHVGAWQAAMAFMNRLAAPVHFQFRTEEHTEGRHFFDLAKRRDEFRLLSPDGFLGGMVEMTQALQAGECVAVMGDRAFGARTTRACFLGEFAEFPVSPYVLGYGTGADVIVLLTRRTGKLAFRIDSVCISDELDMREMSRDEAIDMMLKRYVAALERHLRKEPFMWFNFFDFWTKDSETKRKVKADRR